jgi:hypothetical protein
LKEKFSPSQFGGIAPGHEVTLGKEGTRIMQRGEAGESLTVQRPRINPATGEVVRPFIGPRPRPQIPGAPFRLNRPRPATLGGLSSLTRSPEEQKIWDAKMARSKSLISNNREVWEEIVRQARQRTLKTE